MAHPHHRHQDSLESFINPSPSPPLSDETRPQAVKRFRQIIEHFDGKDPDLRSSYDRIKLLDLIYEHAPSPKSQDNVLKAFFKAISLPTEGGGVDFSDQGQEHIMLDHLLKHANHLFNHFFLPLRASTVRTPQPTPHYRSATMRSSSRDFIGTPERLSTLRGDCLIRDKHRCVISRAFDVKMMKERKQPNGQILDDDGQPIKDKNYRVLEVAHILPHSLVDVTSVSGELNESRKVALEILNMFDNDVAHLINGTDIDRPRNALTLTHDLHQAFGSFEVYFSPVAAANRAHTYEIGSYLDADVFDGILPITRELYLTAERNIEPPSPRLLAFHCAIARILHLSGAGDYIEKLLRTFEEPMVRCDGSTALGQLVQLRLSSWLGDGINA